MTTRTCQPERLDVRCPLPGCPSPRAGTIRPWNAADREWTATTPARPGTVHLAPHPARAAAWLLAGHADTAHPGLAAGAARLLLSTAAHQAGQTALGHPPGPAIAASCSECGRALARDGLRWIDASGSDRCPDDVELCPNFCPGRVGPRWGPDDCRHCGGEGVLYQPHRPGLGPREDGDRPGSPHP